MLQNNEMCGSSRSIRSTRGGMRRTPHASRNPFYAPKFANRLECGVSHRSSSAPHALQPKTEPGMNLIFSSRVPKECRSALEDLLFFNPSQHKVREGIINSLAHFGHPRLEESPAGLTVRVGNHEAQTLFAYDRDRRQPDPIGVVVFLRTSPEEIAIMHVAVHPDYALQS